MFSNVILFLTLCCDNLETAAQDDNTVEMGTDDLVADGIAGMLIMCL